MPKFLEKVRKRVSDVSAGVTAEKQVVDLTKEPEYMELEWRGVISDEGPGMKIRVLPLTKVSDVEVALDLLRRGENIVLLKVEPSFKDKLEVKRAIRRVQKTSTAIKGDIAGVGENLIIATPPEVRIIRPRKPEAEE